MNEQAGFVAALAADPSDQTAALVFADWLDERGDPRGAMMRVADIRKWMAPTYENPLPKLAAAIVSGKGVAEASKRLARIGEASVSVLVPLLTHEVHIVRLRAAKALRLLGPKAAVAIPALTEVVKGTRKEDAAVRREAVALLGVLRAKSGVQGELAKGLESEHAAERLAAVDALVKLRTQTAGAALCKALADPAEEVRRAAAIHLRYTASPAMTFAVEPLRKALADPAPSVAAPAVIALGRIGSKAAAALPDLLARLAAATGQERRCVLEALALVGVGDPNVAETLVRERPEKGDHYSAINHLVSWPELPAAVAPALLETVRRPNTGNAYSDGYTVECALQALARIVPPSPEVLDEFRRQLKGDHGSAAGTCIGELGAAAAPLVPDLAAALLRRKGRRDPFTFAKALGRIGGEGVAVLVQALDGEPDPIPIAAASGLKEADPAALAAAVPALLARLRNPEARAGRALVIEALAAAGPPAAAAAVPDLVRLLTGDYEDHEASSITRALVGLGTAVLPFANQLAATLDQPARGTTHAHVLEVLTGLVPHGFEGLALFREALRRAVGTEFYPGDFLESYRRQYVASAAASGLAALGRAAEPALPDLEHAARTVERSGLVERVVHAYGAIGPAAVPQIIAALAHPERSVRIAAINALLETGDTSAEAREALAKVESDSARMVRAAATSAMKILTAPKKRRSRPANTNP
ncbi:HEAT repeat domain-containing protein [Gemmata sp.]|uniref:HEAT repeat domain-containing protein n=1 Tax=Gemmata sp. TaxID=1914242 RepID=UPI003F70018F